MPAQNTILVHPGLVHLSSKNRKQYGMSTLVKQTVTLRETAKINDRIFQRSECFHVY